MSEYTNIIAGLNQRLFDAYKQREEFGELIGILKGEMEKWKNQAARAVKQTERVAESQGELRDIDYKEIEQLRAENERLRVALEWYADSQSYEYVGNVKHAVTPVHCDMGFRAKEALSQSPAPAKEDKTNGWWMDISSAPEEGRFLAIFDGEASGCEDCTEKEDGKRWFRSDSHGAYPIDEMKYWQHLPQPPINDKQ